MNDPAALVSSVWKWVQTNSNVVGILLSLLGFGVTWVQLIRTRNAAEAAERAATAAAEAIGRVDTVADIASAIAGLKEVQLALRGARFETALLRAQTLRESLHRLRTRTGFSADQRQARIQKMVTDLRKLQDTMERLLADPSLPFTAAATNKILADAAAELSTWSEELRFRNEGAAK
jgi:F0F1-type ATP synthase assembly protein I